MKFDKIIVELEMNGTIAKLMVDFHVDDCFDISDVKDKELLKDAIKSLSRNDLYDCERALDVMRGIL